mgnify:CR=1 FL=1
MIKELMKSIREYKRDSILTPILVSLEVVMECIIPFVVAQLVNEIKAGSGMGVTVWSDSGGDGAYVPRIRSRSRFGLRVRVLRIRQKPAQGYVLPDSGFFL